VKLSLILTITVDNTDIVLPGTYIPRTNIHTGDLKHIIFRGGDILNRDSSPLNAFIAVTHPVSLLCQRLDETPVDEVEEMNAGFLRWRHQSGATGGDKSTEAPLLDMRDSRKLRYTLILYFLKMTSPPHLPDNRKF
jgi:hypothetical protein